MDGIQFKLKTSPVSPEVLHYFAVAHKNMTNLNVEEKSNFLKRSGLIQCENKTCQMGFLSFKGWETHKKKCNGVLTEGVSIQLCSQ